MVKNILLPLVVLLLVSCNEDNIPLVINTPVVSPSALPAIHSPTPPFIPSATPTMIVTSPLPTLTETPSLNPSKTYTPVSTYTQTITPAHTPDLESDILGCNTSIDILHQMGEVTNAYPVIRNYSKNDLTNVCASLSASDEARIHVDKTACIVALPAGYQVVLKLTVDTDLGQDTAIKVILSSNEGLVAYAVEPSCRAIGLPGWLPAKAGEIEPIP